MITQQYSAPPRPRPSSRPSRARAVVATGAVVAALIGGIAHLDTRDKGEEHRMEDCVSDKVGRDVDLQRNPANGQLMRPTEVIDEMDACAREMTEAEEKVAE